MSEGSHEMTRTIQNTTLVKLVAGFGAPVGLPVDVDTGRIARDLLACEAACRAAGIDGIVVTRFDVEEFFVTYGQMDEVRGQVRTIDMRDIGYWYRLPGDNKDRFAEPDAGFRAEIAARMAEQGITPRFDGARFIWGRTATMQYSDRALIYRIAEDQFGLALSDDLADIGYQVVGIYPDELSAEAAGSVLARQTTARLPALDASTRSLGGTGKVDIAPAFLTLDPDAASEIASDGLRRGYASHDRLVDHATRLGLVQEEDDVTLHLNGDALREWTLRVAGAGAAPGDVSSILWCDEPYRPRMAAFH